MTETYDLIFLMTKQLDNEAVVRSLLPHLEKEGAIVTMQNGMPELSVSEVVGEARTYGCTVGWGATLLGPGRQRAHFRTGQPHLCHRQYGRASGR